MTTGTGSGGANPDVVVEAPIDIIATADGPVRLQCCDRRWQAGGQHRALTVLAPDQRGEIIRRHLEAAGVNLRV